MTTPGTSSELGGTEGVPTSHTRYRQVCACVDASPVSSKVIAHAVSIAQALGAELTLMRVLEAGRDGSRPSDPVEWDLRRREAGTHVEMLAHDLCADVEGIHTLLLEGCAAEQICTWAHDHHVDVTVVCSSGAGETGEGQLGSTARRILECAPRAVLLVPASAEETGDVHYRRVLVPLDGSSRAETALPIARRVAAAEQAQLVVVHAVPEPELTEIGPLEPQDEELRDRLLRRNERVAQAYLERIRARITEKGVEVATLMLHGGDARHLLARAIVDERADLTVLTSHGRSGHVDVASGSVTDFLITHATAPLLIVRQHAGGARGRGRAAPSRAGVRLPTLANV